MSRSMGVFAVVVVLALAIYGGARWALGTAPVPDTAATPLPLEQWRALAHSGDERPQSLERILVAEGEFPAFAVIAGRPLREHQRMVFQTHVLRYADGRTVVIDPVHDAELHRQLFGDGFNDSAWESMQVALANAWMILATHEHVDHVAGIARSPHFEDIAAQVHLTAEQIDSPFIYDATFSDAQLARLAPVSYEGIHSPAPGIVFDKAPGHSPGSQWIFVAMADGTEYLFAGDVAWAHANIDERRGRSRLVSALFLNEDQPQVAEQLAALAELRATSPVRIIVSHDEPGVP